MLNAGLRLLAKNPIFRFAMSFRFELAESLPHGIARIADERIQKIRGNLGDKGLPDAEGVHEARKELKTIRGFLRLIRGVLSNDQRRQLNGLFRDVGRQLAVSRDAAALAEAMDRTFGTGRKPTQKFHSLPSEGREILTGVRDQLTGEQKQGLTSDGIGKARALLADAERLLKELLSDKSTSANWSWEDAIGLGLLKTYRRGRSHFDMIRSLGSENCSDEIWHEGRKLAKAFGYQLRCLKPMWPGAVNSLIDQIDFLTEHLGDDHDLALIRNRVLKQQPASDRAENFLLAQHSLVTSIDRRRRRLQRLAIHESRLVYTEKPSAFISRVQSYWKIWTSTRPHIPVPGALVESNGAAG